MNSLFFDASELEPEYKFDCVKTSSGGFLVTIKKKGVKGCFGSLHKTSESAVVYMCNMYNYLLK